MTDAAAIDAQVVDIQNDRQHKGFIKVTLHIAAERGPLLTKILGWPTYTEPVPVAIARLQPVKKETSEKANGAPAKPANTLTRHIAILCGDQLFQRYLNEQSPLGSGPCVDKDDAARIVREICKVESRKDIVPGTDAALLWDDLESQFIDWRDSDKYVEQA